jgi:predicted metal-binding membrane protein
MAQTLEEKSLNAGALTRDRIVLATGLAFVCALAWLFTILAADGMESVPSQPWSIGQFAAVFLMWVIMMGAMMLPAVAPMVDSFITINRRRRERDAPYVATIYFVLGYLLAWSAYSAIATIAHLGLERVDLLDTMMQSSSLWLSGLLFFAAGLYQWTPLKEVCLTRCRSPIGFVLTEWRDGALGAIVMGLRHGGYCIGCCAALMALLFAVAVMSLPWVAALTVLVMIEKLLPGEAFWRHSIGAVLTFTGIVLIGRALFA